VLDGLYYTKILWSVVKERLTDFSAFRAPQRLVGPRRMR